MNTVGFATSGEHGYILSASNLHVVNVLRQVLKLQRSRHDERFKQHNLVIFWES